MNRYLATVNIEQIEASKFTAINVYDGETGNLIDQLIYEFEGIDEIIEHLQEVADFYKQTDLEVWTSNLEIFTELLKTVGLAAVIKHRSDTIDTLYAIRDHEKILRDMYSIKPIAKKPDAPKWRRGLFLLFQNLTNKLKGDFNYEI